MPDQLTDNPSMELLMERVATERCRKSYQMLFTQVAPRLLNHARKQLTDESIALEMVQETMLKLWTKAHLYDSSKGAAITWIYSVARNVKFDLLRRYKHQREWIQGDDLWPILSEDDDRFELPGIMEPIVAEELHRLIDTLPQAQAEVVRLVYLQGASQLEVADSLDLPLGTVKSRLRLGLQKLKEALDV